MICSKQDLKEYLQVELPRYRAGGRLKRWISNSESSILYKHQVLLRKAEYYTNTKRKLGAMYYRIRLNRIQNKYAIHIPLNTCGKGLKIMHVGPVLLNGRVRIGENCSLHINTALAAGGTNDDVPVLGDGIVVGVGAVILGGVHLANHIAVGANAVVNKDFLEENIAIAGMPAKKISNNGSLEWNKKRAREE